MNFVQQASQGHSADMTWTEVQKPDVDKKFVIRSVTYTAKKEDFQLP